MAAPAVPQTVVQVKDVPGLGEMIQVTGAVVDEFDHEWYMETRLLVFSDGTTLRAAYSPHFQVWRIVPVVYGTCRLVLRLAHLEEDHSDVAELHGEITWVRFERPEGGS